MVQPKGKKRGGKRVEKDKGRPDREIRKIELAEIGPLWHRPSPEILELVERVGTVPFEEAVQMGFEKRAGRRISLGIPQEEWLESIQQRIREAPDDEFLGILFARGSRLSAAEYAAACVRVHGFSPGEAGTESELMGSINRARRYDGKIVGCSRTIAKAVNAGVIEEVHDALLNPLPEKRIFDTFELERKLGLHGRLGVSQSEAYSFITSVAGVLETLGLTKKLPPSSASHGKVNPDRWIHSAWADRHDTIPVDNIDFRILSMLFEEGPIQQHEFGQRREIFRTYETGGNLPFTIGSVRQAVGRLERDGLVETKKEATKLFVSLTSRGRGIIERQNTQDLKCDEEKRPRFLTEELRRALLGERRLGLKGEEARTFDRIVNGAMILRRMDRRMQPAEIIRDMHPEITTDSKEYHKQMTYINSLRQGNRPWTGIAIAKLEDTYLPAMRDAEEQGSVERGTARWLEKTYVIGDYGAALIDKCNFRSMDSRRTFVRLGTEDTGDYDRNLDLTTFYFAHIAGPLSEHLSEQPNPDERLQVFERQVGGIPPEQRPNFFAILGGYTPVMSSAYRATPRNRPLEALIELNPDENVFDRFWDRMIHDPGFFMQNDVGTIVEEFRQ